MAVILKQCSPYKGDVPYFVDGKHEVLTTQ